MSEKEYIEREAFIEAKRKQYCADCDRRKGMKNGKMRFCYEIGEAPCRACYVDDLLTDVEDAPTADVVEVRHGEWVLSVYTVDIPDIHRWHEWHCSNCGYVRKAGWEHTEDGRKPDAQYCEHCMEKMDGGIDA